MESVDILKQLLVTHMYNTNFISRRPHSMHSEDVIEHNPLVPPGIYTFVRMEGEVWKLRRNIALLYWLVGEL